MSCRGTITVISLLCVGCGPLTHPMVQRLPEEQQHHVDDLWENMLQPPERLERQTLLDAMVSWQLYQLGIDRLDFKSEKDVLGGRVIMAIHFDRSRPSLDEFTVTYVNRHGKEVRRERFSREEVEESVRFFSTNPCDTQPAPPEQEEVCRLRKDREARLEAATQPAWKTGDRKPAPAPDGQE